MKILHAVLAFAWLSAQGAFQENEELWGQIDMLNQSLSLCRSSSELEGLFQRSVEIALSYSLASQFDLLREDAYGTDDFTTIELYVERAAPAITVLVLGESNNTGVNVRYFHELAEPGTPEYSFFDLAMDGFYAEGKIGTAELPAWMERAGSSAQAATDTELAEIYSEIWEGMSIQFQGYYHQIAVETISSLGGAVELNEDELYSYYSVYDDPYVAHARTAFNSFLDGSTSGMYQGTDLAENLEKYRDYLSDGFVVLSLDPAPMGGYSILLISRDKPDRVFDVWVYETPDSGMELRGFTQSTLFSSDEIAEIVVRYREFLEDDLHIL